MQVQANVLPSLLRVYESAGTLKRGECRREASTCIVPIKTEETKNTFPTIVAFKISTTIFEPRQPTNATARTLKVPG